MSVNSEQNTDYSCQLDCVNRSVSSQSTAHCQSNAITCRAMPVAGLYCKWLIEGEPDARLSLRFLDVSIKPVLDDCRYDGLVVYDGGSTGGDKYGMYCITKPGHEKTIFNCPLIYCNIPLLKSCSPMYSYHVIRPSHIDRYPVIRT